MCAHDLQQRSTERRHQGARAAKHVLSWRRDCRVLVPFRLHWSGKHKCPPPLPAPPPQRTTSMQLLAP